MTFLKLPSNLKCNGISTPGLLTSAQQSSGRGCRPERCLSTVCGVPLLAEYNHAAHTVQLSSQPAHFD